MYAKRINISGTVSIFTRDVSSFFWCWCLIIVFDEVFCLFLMLFFLRVRVCVVSTLFGCWYSNIVMGCFGHAV